MLALLFSRLIPKNTKKGTFLSDIVKKIKFIFQTEIFLCEEFGFRRFHAKTAKVSQRNFCDLCI